MLGRKLTCFTSRSGNYRKFLNQFLYYSDQEKLIRLKEEEIFTLTSECMSLSTDLKNAKSTENSLKQENQILN